MPETAIFKDPTGEGPDIELTKFDVDDEMEDAELRLRKIPEPDPHYRRSRDALPVCPGRTGPGVSTRTESCLHTSRYEDIWGRAKITTSSSSLQQWDSPISESR